MITNAVVTGAAGFIGSALVRRLLQIGARVTAVDIAPLAGSDCRSVIGDVTDPDLLASCMEKDAVIFHMAARASVPGSVADPKGDFKNTLYGLFEVLECARRHHCRVIFPSTASIYDPSNTLPITEKSYVKPSSPYGAAKAAGEAYCAAYFRCYDLDVRIARMFSVYGIGMNRFAIFDIVQKIKANCREIEVLGDGTQIRDYLYIDDAVEGIIRIAMKGAPGEDYNLASGVPIKIRDLASLIADLMGYPEIKIKCSGKTFAGDIPKWYADISKIKRIGFVPRTCLEPGLRKTIDWILNLQR